MTSQRRSGVFWRVSFIGLCIGSLLTLLGTRIAQLEIFSHFQVFGAVAWCAALALFAALPRVRASFWRPRRALGAAVAMLLAHGGMVAWLWLPPRAPALEKEPVDLTVLSFNVRHDLCALDETLKLLASNPPDLLVLTEVPADYAVEGYEHVLHDKPDNIGIWSRYPLENPRATQVDGDRDQLSATVVVGRYRLPMLAVHWRIPIRGGQSRAAETSARIASEQEHLLMVGDLNSTPWSPRMHLLAEHGLRRAHQLGARGTWAADPLHLLTLPIDHVLVKGDVRVEAIEFLPWSYSDHRPLLARVACANRR